MADYLPATSKRRRGRPPTNIRTHPNWPLLVELHDKLERAHGRGIVNFSYDLAQRAKGGGTRESRAKWIERSYTAHHDEIIAEVAARKQRADQEAALEAVLRVHQETRRAVERAAAATVSLDQHPEVLRLQEQQRERDRLVAKHDPLRRWRHLLDE